MAVERTAAIITSYGHFTYEKGADLEKNDPTGSSSRVLVTNSSGKYVINEITEKYYTYQACVEGAVLSDPNRLQEAVDNYGCSYPALTMYKNLPGLVSDLEGMNCKILPIYFSGDTAGATEASYPLTGTALSNQMKNHYLSTGCYTNYKLAWQQAKTVATDSLSGDADNTVIVFFTDGNPDIGAGTDGNSQNGTDALTIANELKGKGVTVITAYYGSNDSNSLLSQMSSSGSCISNATDMGAILDEIESEVNVNRPSPYSSPKTLVLHHAGCGVCRYSTIPQLMSMPDKR